MRFNVGDRCLEFADADAAGPTSGLVALFSLHRRSGWHPLTVLSPCLILLLGTPPLAIALRRLGARGLARGLAQQLRFLVRGRKLMSGSCVVAAVIAITRGALAGSLTAARTAASDGAGSSGDDSGGDDDSGGGDAAWVWLEELAPFAAVAVVGGALLDVGGMFVRSRAAVQLASLAMLLAYGAGWLGVRIRVNTCEAIALQLRGGLWLRAFDEICAVSYLVFSVSVISVILVRVREPLGPVSQVRGSAEFTADPRHYRPLFGRKAAAAGDDRVLSSSDANAPLDTLTDNGIEVFCATYDNSGLSVKRIWPPPEPAPGADSLGPDNVELRDMGRSLSMVDDDDDDDDDDDGAPVQQEQRQQQQEQEHQSPAPALPPPDEPPDVYDSDDKGCDDVESPSQPTDRRRADLPADRTTTDATTLPSFSRAGTLYFSTIRLPRIEVPFVLFSIVASLSYSSLSVIRIVVTFRSADTARACFDITSRDSLMITIAIVGGLLGLALAGMCAFVYFCRSHATAHRLLALAEDAGHRMGGSGPRHWQHPLRVLLSYAVFMLRRRLTMLIAAAVYTVASLVSLRLAQRGDGTNSGGGYPFSPSPLLSYILVPLFDTLTLVVPSTGALSLVLRFTILSLYTSASMSYMYSAVVYRMSCGNAGRGGGGGGGGGEQSADAGSGEQSASATTEGATLEEFFAFSIAAASNAVWALQLLSCLAKKLGRVDWPMATFSLRRGRDFGGPWVPAPDRGHHEQVTAL
jgi:hypothetical protein